MGLKNSDSISQHFYSELEKNLGRHSIISFVFAIIKEKTDGFCVNSNSGRHIAFVACRRVGAQNPAKLY